MSGNDLFPEQMRGRNQDGRTRLSVEDKLMTSFGESAIAQRDCSVIARATPSGATTALDKEDVLALRAPDPAAIVEHYFEIVKFRMTTCYVPACDIDKAFVALGRCETYCENAVRLFDLAAARQRYAC